MAMDEEAGKSYHERAVLVFRRKPAHDEQKNGYREHDPSDNIFDIRLLKDYGGTVSELGLRRGSSIKSENVPSQMNWMRCQQVFTHITQSWPHLDPEAGAEERREVTDTLKHLEPEVILPDLQIGTEESISPPSALLSVTALSQASR
jgi:hypothetical protein